MQKKKGKSGAAKLLLTMAAAILVLFIGAGCQNGNNDDEEETKWTPDMPNAPVGPSVPEKPATNKVEDGFELIKVNLKTVSEADANTEANQSAVISFTWTGEGALTYNVYQSKENERPATATATGLTNRVYFARELEPEMRYYFWIEAVNPNGSTFSDAIEKSTRKKGPQASGGVERGDYPRNIRVVPGSGSLTVSWDLSDRVGWFEVYYAPKNDIKHLDIYTPLVFWYDSEQTSVSGAVDITTSNGKTTLLDSYKSTTNVGNTIGLYPFLSPLATGGGYTGYYIRDGNSGMDGDQHPILGTDDDLLKDGVFYKIGEAYNQGIQDPYKPLDPAFASAIPWDGTAAGTPGTPVKFFGTSTTITGLTNNTEYEVWIRPPNANGERGYGYINGIPGAGNALPSPGNVQVTVPDALRTLNVSWGKVEGATGYRIYASKFSYTPSATASYESAGADDTTYTLVGLDSNTIYNVWVVAEKNGTAGVFGTPVTGTTKPVPVSGRAGDKIIAGTSNKVKTVVYVEVNDDNPLNAGSYILEDGTYLFDHVVLFAANIRNRACNGEGGCRETGVHVHYNENVRHILSNRSKYIQPLQDKGIKVLLGLLGDHDGIGFASMTDAQRSTFIADLKRDVEAAGLDGVDFDDEWASKEDWDHWTNNYATISPSSIWTYPTSSWGWPTTVEVFRNPNMGIVPGNGQLAAPSTTEMTRMWAESGESYYKTVLAARQALGNSKIISLYEYNTGRYITIGGVTNGTATKDGLAGAIDFALQPWYNQYIAVSANGLSNNIYSPFGMDLSGEAYSAQNGAPNPPIVVGNNAQATNTIYDYATRYKKAATDGSPYGMLYFYGLERSADLLKRASGDTNATVTKEDYISMMTSIVFGQKCIVTMEGGDFRKDW
jgi:hypothetical protein